MLKYKCSFSFSRESMCTWIWFWDSGKMPMLRVLRRVKSMFSTETEGMASARTENITSLLSCGRLRHPGSVGSVLPQHDHTPSTALSRSLSFFLCTLSSPLSPLYSGYAEGRTSLCISLRPCTLLTVPLTSTVLSL